MEKYIVSRLDNVKKGNEIFWKHDKFYKNYAEQSKTQENENSKPNNLTFYLDYGALRNEYFDSDDLQRQKRSPKIRYWLRMIIWKY